MLSDYTNTSKTEQGWDISCRKFFIIYFYCHNIIAIRLNSINNSVCNSRSVHFFYLGRVFCQHGTHFAILGSAQVPSASLNCWSAGHGLITETPSVHSTYCRQSIRYGRLTLPYVGHGGVLHHGARDDSGSGGGPAWGAPWTQATVIRHARPSANCIISDSSKVARIAE